VGASPNPIMINSSLSRPRFFALALPLFAALGLSAATAATTITFDGQTSLDSAFPSDSRTVIGNTSSVTLLDDPDQVSLYAANSANGIATRVTLYSATSFSDSLDFVSAGLALTFDDVRLGFASTGNTNNGRFGLSSTATGALGSTANAIYFQINRADSTLSLVQSVNGTLTTLNTWDNTSLGSAYNNYTSLTLTLTATTWAVSGTAQRTDGSKTTTFSGSGSLGVTWTSQTWGEDTFIGLEANQTNAGDSARRSTTLNVGTITATSAIPEPHTAALGAGAACLLLAGWLRRRRGLS